VSSKEENYEEISNKLLDWDLERIESKNPKDCESINKNTSSKLAQHNLNGGYQKGLNEAWNPILLTSPDFFTPVVHDPPMVKKYMMPPSLFSTQNAENTTVQGGVKRKVFECTPIGNGSNEDLNGANTRMNNDCCVEPGPSSFDANQWTAITSTSTSENNPPVSNTVKRFKAFHEDKWNDHFKGLQQYKATHGDCLVPHTYPADINLGRWVKRQRRQYKLYLENDPSSTMTPDRIAQLDTEGFVWDSHDAAWMVKYNMLLKFRRDHGHCCVPSSSKKTTPYSPLATWVKCQRRLFRIKNAGKKCAMTDERIDLLNSIGFAWEVR